MIADLNLNPFDLLTKAFTFAIEKLQAGFDAVPLLRNVGAFGLSIIVLTLVLRSFLFPVFAWQMRATRRSQTEMAKIAPELAELRKKYKGQAQKLQAEVQKLYREHGVSPASSLQGCLPVLIQSVIIWPLYNAIRNASSTLHGDLGFLWINNVTHTAREACCLVAKQDNGAASWSGWLSGLATHPALLILPLAAALATFIQSRMMLMPTPEGATAQQQSMQNMGTQMTTILPFGIFLMALNFPAGIALYWVTQSVYMIVQQYYLVGWGGINMPHWIPGAHRITDLTHEGHKRERAKRRSAMPGPTDPTGGSGVVVKTGINVSAENGLGPKPDQPRTRAMADPVGSPSRINKGSGARRKRR